MTRKEIVEKVVEEFLKMLNKDDIKDLAVWRGGFDVFLTAEEILKDKVIGYKVFNEMDDDEVDSIIDEIFDKLVNSLPEGWYYDEQMDRIEYDAKLWRREKLPEALKELDTDEIDEVDLHSFFTTLFPEEDANGLIHDIDELVEKWLPKFQEDLQGALEEFKKEWME